MKSGCLVLETGEIYKGELLSSTCRGGEVVFNTSQQGYSEIATDPSYYSQILVMTAPLQGNYGSEPKHWESKHMWIQGLVCLEMLDQGSWLEELTRHNIPVLHKVDTRSLVLRLRDKGVVWGAIVSEEQQNRVAGLIKEQKDLSEVWPEYVCVKEPEVFKGQVKNKQRIALIDFGYKKSILNELLSRVEEVKVFPFYSSAQEVQAYPASGVLLSNGPGDPKDIKKGIELVKNLIGWKFILGICMGHQILAHALGAKTYKLKFGHRGSNHPIKDKLTSSIYVSAQNHGYAIDEASLNKDIMVSHRNLNDGTVAGIFSKKQQVLGVQFHPENGPGPREASSIFDFFIKNLQVVR